MASFPATHAQRCIAEPLGHGDLVSRLVMGINGAILRLIWVI